MDVYEADPASPAGNLSTHCPWSDLSDLYIIQIQIYIRTAAECNSDYGEADILVEVFRGLERREVRDLRANKS